MSHQNRGTKGGDLIMEGKSWVSQLLSIFDIWWNLRSCVDSSAKCLVTLANRGEESYKPEVYGDEITIERTLNKSGGGGYKIKNSDGKTVDTKKTTLDAIREWSARLTISNDSVVTQANLPSRSL